MLTEGAAAAGGGGGGGGGGAGTFFLQPAAIKTKNAKPNAMSRSLTFFINGLLCLWISS